MHRELHRSITLQRACSGIDRAGPCYTPWLARMFRPSVVQALRTTSRRSPMRHVILSVTVLTVMALSAGWSWAQDPGPVGPSPYEAVDGWLKPFDEGFTFGGNVGVQPDSPNRIFILQRGSTQLPNPLPPGYLGYAGSINMVPQKGEGRVWRNVIVVVDGGGKVIEA